MVQTKNKVEAALRTQLNRYLDAISGRANVESMANLSDEEIERVFVPIFAGNMLVSLVKAYRDQGHTVVDLLSVCCEDHATFLAAARSLPETLKSFLINLTDEDAEEVWLYLDSDNGPGMIDVLCGSHEAMVARAGGIVPK